MDKVYGPYVIRFPTVGYYYNNNNNCVVHQHNIFCAAFVCDSGVTTLENKRLRNDIRKDLDGESPCH